MLEHAKHSLISLILANLNFSLSIWVQKNIRANDRTKSKETFNDRMISFYLLQVPPLTSW